MSSFYRSNKPYILILSTAISMILVLTSAPLFTDALLSLLSKASYVVWHNVFEFSSIIISICIFCVAYYSFEQNRNYRNLFLGSMLLLMAFIDFFHTMTFKGMPAFLVPDNSANTATTFWIIARLIGGFGLLAASIIPVRSNFRCNKIVCSIMPLLISLFVLKLVIYHPGVIPEMYIDGKGLTDTKVFLEGVVILLYSAAVFFLMRQYVKTKDMYLVIFSCALIVGISSELAFTLYTDVYGIYNFIGHLLKFIMYYTIFRVTFIQNIRQPYLELSVIKDEIKNYADNLDKIVEQRTEQINSIYKHLLEDLEYARDIQCAMLPKTLPQTKNALFEAYYIPAERVSGDFYNIFKIDDTKIGLYIGDVSGHGVSAAMLTVFLNQSIKPKKENSEGKKETLPPSEVLANLYADFNLTNFKSEVYIVMLYGIYDLTKRELTFASAGLNVSPLIISDSGEVTELKIKGFPICKFPEGHNLEYSDSTIKFNPGDRVLFYTDGLIEAENRDNQAYTEARLKAQLKMNSGHDIAQFAKGIADDVYHFIEDIPLHDDITYFVMEVK